MRSMLLRPSDEHRYTKVSLFAILVCFFIVGLIMGLMLKYGF